MSRKIGGVPDYVPVEQARHMPGLRIAFTKGLNGPWGVGARALFDIKGIDYVAVPQIAGDPNSALKEWTGQSSAPVAMLNDDRPRALWSEMIVLAEQLQPEPRLIPTDEDQRIEMFGLCHEICGDDGLGWNMRLLLFAEQRKEQFTTYSTLHSKYDSPVEEQHARGRLNSILDALARRLEAQARAGSRYFVGDRLSPVDLYWAGFSNLVVTIDEEVCHNSDFYRGLAASLTPYLDKPVAKILLDHRDFVVREHFPLPIAF